MNLHQSLYCSGDYMKPIVLGNNNYNDYGKMDRSLSPGE